MSMKSKTVVDFNGQSVTADEYHPVWLNRLADDVTLEGSAMNGFVQGPEAVRSIVTYIRTLYDRQQFNFAGSYGENGFLEDYTAWVQGEPIGNVVLVTRDGAGHALHIVANYRPRSTLLLTSRLIGDHFAGTPYGAHFAASGDSNEGCGHTVRTWFVDPGQRSASYPAGGLGHPGSWTRNDADAKPKYQFV
jgi:hypothetical protein